jgi:hypothetical protein
MDKMLILGLFGHFHTEVNPEMIPNLFGGLRVLVVFTGHRESKNRKFFKKIYSF